MSVTTLALAPEHADALSELFARAGCGCHCRWWHFSGDKNAWLDRLAHAPEQNLSELRAAIAAGSDEMRGVIALWEGGQAIGWMKLAPATVMQKLYGQKPYRGLPCFDGDRTGVLVVGCFLVDPEHRERGVSGALLERGIELARQWGARAIEAFPRAAEPITAELAWTGFASVFERAGFVIADAPGPYPVLRKLL